MAAIGQRRQRVVMREIPDMLLRLLACPEVANGDHVMRPPCEHDRPQDQFDRADRSVGMAQNRFDLGVSSPPPIFSRGGAGRKTVWTGWFEPASNFAQVARSGKQLSSRAPTRFEAHNPDRDAKLVLIET